MPHISSLIKDPWDIEHEQSLLRHPNAIAHSDRFYTGVIHKGFDADATAEELIRKYPVFEETEQHREFLVRSISERLIVPGERHDYFTPEQLWEEDDRINGKRCFSKKEAESGSDEESVVDELSGPPADVEVAHAPVILKAIPKGVIGEEQLESDEQLAQLLMEPALSKRPAVQKSLRASLPKQSLKDVAMADEDLAKLFGEQPEQPTIVITTPDAKLGNPKHDGSVTRPADDLELPIILRTDNHTTTITCDYADMQRVLHSLDLSHEIPLTAISHKFVDGSLVLALFGHIKSDGCTPDAGSADKVLNHPTEVGNTAAVSTKVTERPVSEERVSCGNEWSIVTQRPHHPTVAFLSGHRTCNALVEDICWDPDTIVATSVTYSDGRVLVLLFGVQHDQYARQNTTTHDGQSDLAKQFDTFFDAVRRDKNIPAEHSELASLLHIAHKDMIHAGALNARSLNEDAADSSDDEYEIPVPISGKRQTSEHIRKLKKCTKRIERQLARAREAAKYTTTRSSSLSQERMQQILQRPKADYVNFSHVDDRQRRELVSQDAKDQPPADEQTNQNTQPLQQVSGFPAKFSSNSGTEATVSASTASHPPAKKRKRAPPREPKADASDEGKLVDDDDDEGYASRPQRKRKIAKSVRNTKSKAELKPKQAEDNASTPLRRKKKPAHKATTAVENAMLISDVKAQLARFHDRSSVRDGSVDISQTGVTDSYPGSAMEDSDMDGEDTAVLKKSDGEESEEE